MIKRVKGVIHGIVQGVGFRPFVYQLASRFHLSGYVINTSQGVDIEIEGLEIDIQSFVDSLTAESPPLAHIASSRWIETPLKNEKTFEIKWSRSDRERSTLISADVCTCRDCLSEMRDPKNRRYRYPFINCTNCGPRYTIIMDIPYDRAATTMREFSMCPACSVEYHDPGNRRFHAQPNACWECGPTPRLHDAGGEEIPCSDPIQEAISLLANGRILAIKGLGGFHLAVNASDSEAVKRLRKRKHREEKPLAIMVRDLQRARGLAHIDRVEAQLLTSRQRPILLLRKRRSHGLSPHIAPRNKYMGLMFPYTPLHHLFMDGPFRALVMTSGNMTEEPITTNNKEAFTRLKGIADYFLTHNRDIYLRSDDSVIRVADQAPRQIRRSRGYVPIPVFLSQGLKDLPSVLAVGGELKNTICLTKENRAFLSQHIGDMENLETFDFFQATISHLERILDIHPVVIARDLHPDYLSSKFVQESKGSPVAEVQHHHAHIVSCLAENGQEGPVIGLAMDGAGLGTDGRIWGGEIMLSDLTSFQREAHLDYVPLPGGDAAARFPWRMALIYLHKAYGEDLFHLPIPFVRNLDPQEAKTILQMAEKGINSPLTSSCGRLFDAVSSLLGLRHRVAYEGQAAVELEMSQNDKEKRAYPWQMERQKDGWVMMATEIVKGIVQDIIHGRTRGAISGRFHNTLIQMFVEVCIRIREDYGVGQVALSGGAFQNVTLLSGLTKGLDDARFTVYSHTEVPTNDGSLCLGQAVCAGLRHTGMKGRFGKTHEIHG